MKKFKVILSHNNYIKSNNKEDAIAIAKINLMNDISSNRYDNIDIYIQQEDDISEIDLKNNEFIVSANSINILSYVEYCKCFIINNIEKYEGIETFYNSINYLLIENAKNNRSIEYNKYDTIAILKQWWHEVDKFLECLNPIYKETNLSPFNDPEFFHVEMVNYGIFDILYNCPYVKKNWHKKTSLSKKVINKIIDETKRIKNINFKKI